MGRCRSVSVRTIYFLTAQPARRKSQAPANKNRPAEAGRNQADAVGGPSSEASKLWHRLEWERRGSGSAPGITSVAVINYQCWWLRRLREAWLSGSRAFCLARRYTDQRCRLDD
jgi:hypothetical protein